MLIAYVDVPLVPERARAVALDRVLYASLPWELAVAGLLCFLVFITAMLPGTGRILKVVTEYLLDSASSLATTLSGLIVGGSFAVFYLERDGSFLAVGLVVGLLMYLVIREILIAKLQVAIRDVPSADRTTRGVVAVISLAGGVGLFLLALLAPLPQGPTSGTSVAEPCATAVSHDLLERRR